MREVLYTPRAQQDMEEIWDYTVARWGVAQADSYIRIVVTACERIAEGSTGGQPAEDIRAGYWRQIVASHVVFYREQAERIVVVRILHQRMDVASHFE